MRFETSKNSYLNVAGLGVAVRQDLDLGLGAIERRTLALDTQLREDLGSLPSATVADLGVRRCVIVTYAVDGSTAAQVIDRLPAQRINVSTTVPEHTQFDIEDRNVHSSYDVCALIQHRGHDRADRRGRRRIAISDLTWPGISICLRVRSRVCSNTSCEASDSGPSTGPRPLTDIVLNGHQTS